MAFVSRKEQEERGIVQGAPRRFETAAPQQQPQQSVTALATVQPIKPAQLTDSFHELVSVYREQSKQASKTGDIVTDNSQDVRYRLSTASELAERRRTARMYLCFLGFVVAAVTTGVVWIADIARVTSSAAQSIAMWLILFGAIQSWLTWRHLQREQGLSPEGLHQTQIELDHAVHMTDAETRRLAVDYMGRAELGRVQLQQSQVDAQRESNHRLTLETQQRISEQMQRHTQPQSSYNRLNTWRPSQPGTQQGGQHTVWDAQERPEWPVGCAAVGYEVEAPAAPIADPVRLQLLNWTADLYLDRDEQGVYRRMDSSGRLAKGVIAPWSKRGGLSAAQRQQLLEVLRQIQPPLFQYDELAKAWCLNLQRYPRVIDAVAAIDGALTPARMWE